MIPADRVVKSALEAGIALFANEALFRTAFEGMPDDELDKLWASWNSDAGAPEVALGLGRERFRIPRWQVSLNDCRLGKELSAGQRGADAATQQKRLYASYVEIVQVSVMGRTPDEASWHWVLARGSLRMLRRAIHATPGVEAIHFMQAADLDPFPHPTVQPAHVYHRASLWSVTIAENLYVATPPAGVFFDSVSVVQKDYTDVDDIPGGVSLSEEPP